MHVWHLLILSVLTLLVACQEENTVHKNECLQQSADVLHVVQLMPLPPDHLLFIKFRTVLQFTILYQYCDLETKLS